MASAQPILNKIAGINEPVNRVNPAAIIPNPKYPIPKLKFIELYRIPFPGIARLFFLNTMFSTYPVIKIIVIAGLKIPCISKVFIDKLIVSLSSAPANRSFSDSPDFIINASNTTTPIIGKTPNTKPNQILLNFVLANPIFKIFILLVTNRRISVIKK